MRWAFDRHVLDGAGTRAALLDLMVRLGGLLRGRGQVARALTLTLSLTFAGPSALQDRIFALIPLMRALGSTPHQAAD